MPKYAITLDIGATKTLVGLISGNKIIKTKIRRTGSKKNNTEIIKNIKNAIKSLWEENVNQIGVGIAGQVDNKKGIIVSTTNFNQKFKNIKLVDILTKEFKIPVMVDNDVKCFVKSEIKNGYGKTYKNFIGLTFGTGIGGGIVVDGQLVRGEKNLAGEIGHMKIAGKWSGVAPQCGCGNKYCFESVASGSAWWKMNKKHGKKQADKIIINNIAVGLNNLATILNPECFILGGGLMEHKNIINQIRKSFREQCKQSMLKDTKILKSKLGDQTILFGTLLN
ncbi:MAG: ROK family protein [Patescibacteria group bacterium]